MDRRGKTKPVREVLRQVFLVRVRASGGAPGIAYTDPHPSEAAHHTTNLVFIFFDTGTLFSVT